MGVMFLGKREVSALLEIWRSPGSATKLQRGPQDAGEPFCVTYCACCDMEVNQATEIVQIMVKGVGKRL